MLAIEDNDNLEIFPKSFIGKGFAGYLCNEEGIIIDNTSIYPGEDSSNQLTLSGLTIADVSTEL